MTLTTLEPTTIEHLDFQPACGTTYCKHGRPDATHAIVTSECSHFACTPCSQYCREIIRMAANQGRKLFCNHHPGRLFFPDEIRVEPLS